MIERQNVIPEFLKTRSYTIKQRLWFQTIVFFLSLLVVFGVQMYLLDNYSDIRHEHDLRQRQLDQVEAEFNASLFEWKNIIIRGTEKAKFRMHYALMLSRRNVIQDLFTRIGDMDADEQLGEQYRDLKASYKKAFRQTEKALEKYNKIIYSNTKNFTTGQLLRMDARISSQELDFTSKLDKFHTDVARAAAAKISSAEQKLVVFILSMLGLVLAGGMLFGTAILRSITSPLESIQSSMENLGDFHFKAGRSSEQAGKDEIHVIATSMRKMTRKLQAVLRKITNASTKIDSTSEEMKSSTSELIQRSMNSAAVTEQLSASMEEVTASSESINVNIQNAIERIHNVASNMENLDESAGMINNHLGGFTSLTSEARSLSSEGGSSIQEVNHALNQVGSSLTRIDAVMGILSDISDQTNLLALNASIEAARAGESGRGFAVVADEISKLSEKTLSGVQETKSLVTSISESFQSSTTFMEKATRNFEQISGKIEEIDNNTTTIREQLAEQTRKTGEVNRATSEMTSSAEAIASSNTEQKMAYQEINNSISGLSGDSQVSLGKVEELNKISIELKSLSEELKSTVSIFKFE
jgi:methyl-accepting chemotaxis protein